MFPQVRIDLLPESHPIEFIEDRLVDPLTDPIRLWILGLGLRMLNVIELEIELMEMFIQSSTELGSPIRQDS